VVVVGVGWIGLAGFAASSGARRGQMAAIYSEDIQLLGPGSQTLRFADLNGDGWQDVALSRGSQTYLRFNQNGHFGATRLRFLDRCCSSPTWTGMEIMT